MSCGIVALSPSTSFPGRIRCRSVKVATWPRAWTPASVRPDPSSSTSSPVIFLIAFSMTSWIASPFFCVSQPQ